MCCLCWSQSCARLRGVNVIIHPEACPLLWRRCWKLKIMGRCVIKYTHAFSHWPRVSLIQASATTCCESRPNYTPLDDWARMQGQFLGRKMTFRLALLTLHLWPWVIIFRVIFWFDRRSLVEWNGKSNDVPNAREEARCSWGDGGYWRSKQRRSAPGASQQLFEKMELYPMLPHRFLLVPGTCCYLGWLLSPVWLLSTLSERLLSTFIRFTALSVSS